VTQFLTDKVALITGATRGIGAATAESFAGHGAKVVLNYGRSREEAEAVVTRIRARAVRRWQSARTWPKPPKFRHCSRK